ncbi:hypothetical protein D9Q81_01695 [Candidatus Korarchaeum cryptofilum]|jgi:diacylglycerol kinase|uniref:Uncharacterized protein n=2 Tax=Candidatus Korarchaeum cryptofilum TaxID=498846 RepID=B1L723_KORCO|nr:hypothetical protein [Candidatus Korarchaeum cryptofilum]ACB08252.1 hypothetical protein Kcr_1506 [Candidatus Korarchaeum cryptofilum OPF8]RSN70051.1 hypothetical protein D9Q81_01695 [Candidatus Korarchaeum cryptofilum]
MKAQGIIIHPSLGIFIILASIMIFGSIKFGLSYQWLLASLSGLASFTLGAASANRLGIKFLMISSEIALFTILSFSFLRIAGYYSFIISFLWLIVANISSLLIRTKEMRVPIYSIPIFILGASLVIYSYLKIPNIAELRASPSVPIEGAFGMFLIFISYPSIFSWISESNSIYAALFSIAGISLMLLHGFRADAILVILSTFLLVWRRNKRLSYLLLVSVLLLYIGVDVIRTKLAISAIERPIFRLSTTYYYSKELASYFFKLIPIEPFWLTSIPLHQSQTIGRGIFGKDFGITPTIFIGMLMDLGFIGMLLLSFLIGSVAGHSYMKFISGDDEFSYPIIWPIIITRTEIGLTQLDLALIFGSTIFSLLLNFFNGSRSSQRRVGECRTTTTVP